ncbi:MAG: ATP-binding protein [Bacteroidetes bacterium]|nr:ATP-binding protein [Bacteroidota bacterium]
METNQQIDITTPLFGNSYLDSKSFYMHRYKQIPSVILLTGVHAEKAIAYIESEYNDVIEGRFRSADFNRKKGKVENDILLIVLKEKCMLEFDGAYCELLYAEEDVDMANTLIKEISRFKERQKKKEFEINLVSKGSYGLELKSIEINKTKLNLELYYEDDFLETDRLVQTRLSKKNDKGIVLLHGLPGTGKTTYLRYLVGKLKKRVLFLSPSLAGNIMHPEFMELLIDNPNSVLIIEDAENVIMDRRMNSDSAVSNLLNISDGLLSDFLNVQVICTFNHPISMIDTALLRKGRLIAKYEFGKLSIAKAQRLSHHLGFNTIITEPMTVASIANQHEKATEADRIEVIGFRRTANQLN